LEKILVVGSSGHARVVIDIVQQEGRYEIVGLVDRYRCVDETVLGYPIVGGEEDLPDLMLSKSVTGIVVAIGDNFVRSQMADFIERHCPELCFISAIHPRASIAPSVSVGEGTVAMAGAVVNANSSIGRFCILNTNSSLDHDSVMEDFSSLAPGVTTGGNCKIGHTSAIGIGATLCHQVAVGQHTIVGAGSLLLKSVGSYVVTQGVPAKVVRQRKKGDSYL